MPTTRHAATRSPSRAAALEADETTTDAVPPGTFVGEPDPPAEVIPQPEGVRSSPNAWWCPIHDRAMPLTNPPTPCDVGGEVPADFGPDASDS